MLVLKQRRVAAWPGRSTILVLAVCELMAGACAPRRAPAEPGVSEIQSGTSTIYVLNRQWVDVRIYVAATEATYRLGIVPRLGSGQFPLPAGVRTPADLTFFAVPLGSDERLVVGPIAVDFGNRLVFTIDKSGSTSTVVKRP